MPDGIVRQEKLTELRAEEGRARLDSAGSEPLRLRVRIGIERRVIDARAARPKARTAHLMGIGLAHDRIGQPGDAAWVGRCTPAGKARDCQIEASPEEMHGAAFTGKAGAELLKNAVYLQQSFPEALGKFWVVGCVRAITAERNGPRDFVRKLIDADADACLPQFGQKLLIELSDRARLKRKASLSTVARLYFE